MVCMLFSPVSVYMVCLIKLIILMVYIFCYLLRCTRGTSGLWLQCTDFGCLMIWVSGENPGFHVNFHFICSLIFGREESSHKGTIQWALTCCHSSWGLAKSRDGYNCQSSDLTGYDPWCPPLGRWGRQIMFWMGGLNRNAVKWGNSITFSEEIGNYIKKINE